MACKFNGHLHCTDTDPKRLNGCCRCGWNPEVDAQRKDEVREERQKQYQKRKKAAPDGANIEDGRPDGQQSSTPSV